MSSTGVARYEQMFQCRNVVEPSCYATTTVEIVLQPYNNIPVLKWGHEMMCGSKAANAGGRVNRIDAGLGGE